MTRRYQGDKMLDSTSSKFTAAFLSRIVGGSKFINIIRVDKQVTKSELNVKKTGGAEKIPAETFEIPDSFTIK